MTKVWCAKHDYWFYSHDGGIGCHFCREEGGVDLEAKVVTVSVAIRAEVTYWMRAQVLESPGNPASKIDLMRGSEVMWNAERRDMSVEHYHDADFMEYVDDNH
jgi:hypothetical protein